MVPYKVSLKNTWGGRVVFSLLKMAMYSFMQNLPVFSRFKSIFSMVSVSLLIHKIKILILKKQSYFFKFQENEKKKKHFGAFHFQRWLFKGLFCQYFNSGLWLRNSTLQHLNFAVDLNKRFWWHISFADFRNQKVIKICRCKYFVPANFLPVRYMAEWKVKFLTNTIDIENT